VPVFNREVAAANRPPAAAADSYSTNQDTALTVGAATGVLFNDSDPDGDSLGVTRYTQPAHGTVTVASDGSFTYTPAAGYSGGDSFTYTVSDRRGGTATGAVALTVNHVNRAPVAGDDRYSTAVNLIVLSTPLSVGAPGVLGNDSDADGDALTMVLVSGPSNGLFSFNANGSFSYTALLNFSGTDSFTYRAFDGTAYSAPVTVSINVSSPNRAPAAAADSYSTAEDTPLAVSAPGVLGNDSDPDGDTLTAVLDGGPAHGSLNFRADGSFTYTPDPNYNGTDSFTYHANDGSLDSQTVTVTLTVAPVNDAPSGTDDSATVAEDGSVAIDALTNDTDPDGDALSVTTFTQPAHGTAVLNPDGSFTYTPAPYYSGSDSFDYTVDDGNGGTASATVYVTVTHVNHAPAAGNDSATTAEDSPVTIAVLSDDADADGDALTVTGAGPALHGTVATDGTTVTYTPDPDFTGTDTFTYAVDDGNGGTTTATVTVTVTPANAPPGASGDAYATTRGATLTVAAPGLLANDSDPNGDALTVSLVGAPLHGALLLNADGSFTYAPDPGFAGTDAFTYRAVDPYGATSGTAAVTIRVDAPAEAPGAGGGTSSASASAGSGTQVALGAPPIGVPRVDVASAIGEAEASSVASARADGAPAEDGAASAAQPAAVSFMIASNSGAPAALPAADAKPALGEVPAVSPKSAPPEPAAPAPPQTPAVAPQNFAERPVASGPRPSPEPPDPQAAIEIVGESLEKVTRDIEADADERAATDAVVTTAAVATAGYVLLNTRAVYWFISALLARPAVWRRFDPIDVIYTWEKERPAGDEDESLQSMVG
jgi:VCBS repeat-containing protein